jgi:hypothetical protein
MGALPAFAMRGDSILARKAQEVLPLLIEQRHRYEAIL